MQVLNFNFPHATLAFVCEENIQSDTLCIKAAIMLAEMLVQNDKML